MIAKKQYILLYTLLLCVVSNNAMQTVDTEVYRRVCRKYPSDFICKEALQRLNTLRNRINTCCDELDLLFTTVEDNLFKFNPCGPPTLINQASFSGGLFTISSAGLYCLEEDVSGQINIESNNVILDLAERTFTGGFFGINIEDDVRNIIVRNGILTGGFTSGVIRAEAENLLIENITFGTIAIPNRIGVLIFSSNNFIIRNCFFSNNEIPLRISNTRNGKIQNCIFTNAQNDIEDFAIGLLLVDRILFSNNIVSQNATTKALELNGARSCVIENSRFNNNTGTTTRAVLVTNGSSDCTITNCEANQNPNAVGFLVNDSSEQIIIDSCRALNNDTGFWLNAVNQNCILNSLAKQNIVDGYLVNDGSNNYLHANTALNNGNGFAGSGSTVWTSNYAQANTTNYTVGIPGPFSTLTISTGVFAPTETAWDNIDAQP